MNRASLTGLTTSKVRSVSIRRGRSRWTDSFPAGSCSVVLDNRDASYNPFAGNDIGDQIRVRFDNGAGSVVNVFTGRIVAQNVNYTLDGDAVYVANLLDDLAAVARWSIPSSYAGTLSSALSGTIMDLIDLGLTLAYSGLDFDNDAGSETLKAITLTTGEMIIDVINRITQTEQGRFFCNASGTLRFEERNVGEYTSSLTFTDDPLISGVRYNDIQVSTSSDVLANVVNITNEGGSLQQAVNSSSEAVYGPYEYSISDALYTSDARALEMATYLATIKGSPAARFATINVQMHALSDADAALVAGLEIGDLVRVVFTPPGGTQQDRLVYIEGFDHRISIDTWDVTLSFSEFEFVPFILDSAANGVLDTNRLGI